MNKRFKFLKFYIDVEQFLRIASHHHSSNMRVVREVIEDWLRRRIRECDLTVEALDTAPRVFGP